MDLIYSKKPVHSILILISVINLFLSNESPSYLIFKGRHGWTTNQDLRNINVNSIAMHSVCMWTIRLFD